MMFLVSCWLAFSGLAQSPTPISRQANLSVFSGYFAKRQNTNNNGHWLGVYGDIPLYRSPAENWNVSLYGLYVQSQWTDNLGPYSAKTRDFAAGLSTGYYSEFFSFTHAFYGALALGYKNSRETGEVKKKKYNSLGKQRDHLLTGSLNLNLIKYSGFRPRLLPRTQLVFSWQTPLNAEKTLSANGEPANIVNTWNKGYQEIALKQSLVDIPLGYAQNYFLQPKIGYQYSHYQAGVNKNAHAPLFELALHKDGQDDFFTVTVMQKFNGQSDNFFIYCSINLLKIK